jgi:hypothetical protein
METVTVSEKLKTLAKDLRKDFPRSPRETLAGYVLAARALDKCRAKLCGIHGAYKFNQRLDRMFFDFTGIDAEAFEAYVATGADDEEVAAWIRENSRIKERAEIVTWNNRMRSLQIRDLPDSLQEYIEDYVEQNVPKHRPIYAFFDMFDLEEGRL